MIFAKKIEQMYRARLFKRYDDTGCVFYFSPDDFPSLNAEPYTFKSKKGDVLKGYFYSYGEPIANRLIVFDHGMGAGHRAYMKEIELLAKHGYLVFSYDHTGCFESEGAHTGGLSQSCSDLCDCITAIKSEEKYKNLKIAVMGHSWGAISTLNVSHFHPDLTHVIAIAGPISLKQMLASNFGGIMKGYAKHLYAVEETSNPTTASLDARESLLKTDAKILLIYSEDDPIVKKKFHYDALYTALSEKENVRFVLEKNKKHNPNYTEDAVAYMDSFFAELTEKLKKGQLTTDEAKKEFTASYDWHRMTAQDGRVWDKIFLTLDN